MLKRTLITMFALVALVASCRTTVREPEKASHEVASDSYYFEKATASHQQFSVIIHSAKSSEEIHRLASKIKIQGDAKPDNVIAFSNFYEKKGKWICEIWIVDPAIKYQPEFLGHEITHCMYGYWHRQPQD